MVGIKELKINVRALTPVSMGGYDTQVFRRFVDNVKLHEPPRATSIKGIWRWWLRALAAGVAFDTNLDEEEAAIEVAKRLLGYAGEGGAGRSKFQLSVDVRQPLGAIELTQRAEYSGIARIRLLRKDACSAYPPNYELTITARGLGVNDVEAEAGFWSLLCALALQGVGKISRRGFGSLLITRAVVDQESFAGDILGKLRQLEDAEPVKDGITHLINTARKAVGAYIEEKKIKQSSAARNALPKIPAIATKPATIGDKKILPATVHLTRLAVDATGALHYIGAMCTRSMRVEGRLSLPCNLLNLGDPTHPPKPETVRKYPVCILGLPRSVGSTGYATEARRASPLVFKVLASDQKRSSVVVTTLASSDWPDSVPWSSPRRRIKIEISETTVAEVMEKIRGYLANYKFTRVWP